MSRSMLKRREICTCMERPRKNFALNVGCETWMNVESKCAGAVRMWISLHRLGRIDLSLAGRNRTKKHEMTLRAKDTNNFMLSWQHIVYKAVQWYSDDTVIRINKSCTNNIKHLLHSIQVIHSVLAMPTISPCLELNMSDTSCYQHYLVGDECKQCSTCLKGVVSMARWERNYLWSGKIGHFRWEKSCFFCSIEPAGPSLLASFWKCLDVYDVFFGWFTWDDWYRLEQILLLSSLRKLWFSQMCILACLSSMIVNDDTLWYVYSPSESRDYLY